MNRKTIHAVISKKMEDWIKTIEDESLRIAVRKDVIVTGGAIASMLLGERPKDFDVYFKAKDTTRRVAQYYVDTFNKAHGGPEDRFNAKVEEDNGRIRIMIKSAGVAAEDENTLENPFEDVYDVLENADNTPAETLDDKPKYRPVFLSSNAITLSDQVQIVVRFYGEPEEIHKNYDFVHCTNYWTFSGKTELKANAMEALLNKELIYQGSRYPLCSVIRTRKFIQRGFRINACQYLKMCLQISDLDLNNISVLEDQLIGVDSAYFNMLINSLKKKQEETPGFQYDQSYVASIIDRIF